MKRILLYARVTTIIILVSCTKSNAQYLKFLKGKAEIGLNLGPSNFLGDLGGNKGIGKTFLKDNNIELTKILSGGYISYYPKEWIGIRISGQHTKIEGDDKIIANKGGAELARKWRNLDFRSKITELYIAAEFYPTVFFEYDDYLSGKFRPMLLGGIGIFSFNPQTNLNGQWVDLRPLSTEGQGFPQYPNRKVYGKTAFSYPVGIGFKYYPSEKFTIGMEAVHRFTSTDYIDDVSTKYIDPSLFAANLPAAQAALALQLNNRSISPQNPGYSAPGAIRGDPTENDGFYSFALKIGWRLGGEEEDYNRRARRQMKCYY
jgi:opacity protein-like surface antigen